MDPANGAVVLIDEIDKAEADVPNGLLEALGDRSFQLQGHGRRVTAAGEPPLVVITTNEERALPDAFVRRCLVHEMCLPDQESSLVDHLAVRGQAHFERADPATLTAAAKLVWSDRERARKQHWFPLPGQAEEHPRPHPRGARARRRESSSSARSAGRDRALLPEEAPRSAHVTRPARIGRADLRRVLDHGDDRLAARAADMLGYQVDLATKPDQLGTPQGGAEEPRTIPGPPPQIDLRPLAPTPFWLAGGISAP